MARPASVHCYRYAPIISIFCQSHKSHYYSVLAPEIKAEFHALGRKRNEIHFSLYRQDDERKIVMALNSSGALSKAWNFIIKIDA